MLGWYRKYNGDSGEGIMEIYLERRGKEIYQMVTKKDPMICTSLS